MNSTERGILVVGYGGEYFDEEHVKVIADFCNLTKVYTVGDVQRSEGTKSWHMLDVWKFLSGDFNEYINQSYKPLDDDVLDFMDRYSTEILKIGDRMGEFVSFEVRLDRYLRYLKFWDNFLEQENIAFVYFTNIPHEMFDYIIYRLCEYKNIKRLSQCSIIGEQQFILFNNYETMGRSVLNEYKKLKEEFGNDNLIKNNICVQALNDFNKWNSQNDKAMTPFYMLNIHEEELRRRYKFDMAKIYKNWKLEYEKKAIIYKAIYILKLLRRIYKGKSDEKSGIKRTEKLLKQYDDYAVAPNYEKEKYIYFPLHYQPEATSAPMGGGLYSTQIIALDILTHNLPEEFFVYVKEHPAQTAFGRYDGFYDGLIKLPRLKFINRKESTYDLIRNCVAVSSLTGTVGIEGLFYNKPFLMFGYTLLQYAPGVFHIRTNKECRESINKILEGNIKIDKDDLLIFLQAEYNCSFESSDLNAFKLKLQTIKEL